jgi:hypothetical protein
LHFIKHVNFKVVKFTVHMCKWNKTNVLRKNSSYFREILFVICSWVTFNNYWCSFFLIFRRGCVHEWRSYEWKHNNWYTRVQCYVSLHVKHKHFFSFIFNDIKSFLLFSPDIVKHFLWWCHKIIKSQIIFISDFLKLLNISAFIIIF